MDPFTQAMLAAGGGLLAAGSYSTHPVSGGQALGQGMLAGLGGYNAGIQNQRSALLAGLQAKKLEREIAGDEAWDAYLKNRYGGGQTAVPSIMQGSGEGVAPWIPPQSVPQLPQGGSPGAIPPEILRLSPDRGKFALDVLKYENPEIKRDGGIPWNPRTGQIIQGAPIFPQINPHGFATTPVIGQDGRISVGVTPGSPEAFRQQLDIQEKAKAGSGPAKALIGGREYETTQAVANAIHTGFAQDEQTALAAQQLMLRAGQLPNIRTGRAGGPALPPGARPTQAETAGATAFAEGKAKEAVGESARFRDAYFQGAQSRGNLDLLETIFSDPNVASGAAAEQISGLKGLADSFGINIAGKNYEDVARAVGGEMALRMKNQGGVNLMPGAMSNFEQQLLKQMSPGLAQGREGRQLMVQVFKAKVDRDMALAELAAQYEDQHGRLDGGFYRQAREFVKKNPMFDETRIKAMTEYARRLSAAR